jgi:hypothetical protein
MPFGAYVYWVLAEEIFVPGAFAFVCLLFFAGVILEVQFGIWDNFYPFSIEMVPA